MPRAVFNGTVVAESDAFENVEGNVYFPPDSIRKQYFTPSAKTTICPWKGTAHYHNVVVDGVEKSDAAWYYPDPKPAAANIKDHIAFYGVVDVQS